MGIIMYDGMIEAIGGDSIRYSAAGYNLQGWKEDYYKDGKLLHKGFYVNGLIKIFKNYYSTGQVERSFRKPNPLRSYLETYYPDGGLKSKVDYYGVNPQKQYQYFPNGNPKSVLESDKDLEYIYKRKSFFTNGKPEKVFEITDLKRFKYSEKEYYANGQVKKEGKLKLDKTTRDYQKIGTWHYYKETGELEKKEKYKKGVLVN